ncbi:MAG: LEA type 2 family protein [Syntrophothermus sp.]
MKKVIAFSTLMILSIVISSCTVTNQISQMAALALCDFRINSVSNVTLAGVNVQTIRSLQDLSIGDAARLMTAAASGSFPLAMQVNIDVKNPNGTAAGMNRMEWILFIDDIQMTSGVVNQSLYVPANNGVASLPIGVAVDLKKVLQGKSLDALVNFGLNLSGNGNKPTRLLTKIKPTILIGQTQLAYPGYINVRTEFGH